MSKQSNKNSKVSTKSVNTKLGDLPKAQDEQLQEGTLLMMEDALEERHKQTRRVADPDERIPASEDRRKAGRRHSDKVDQS